ncbi:major facilitator superfamily transporter [Penicillium antarcticum]|uniref:major facilitator superfamily transporter n=1 Tax=Penicillium antarcticum TaxID=416450 RepID=UPI00239464F6|nr:major facilitator superfamily transporter [Penicillium antarcticum]KAJ5293712.1 major facilitator superfamily transporter [Penicillium antarcticum]
MGWLGLITIVPGLLLEVFGITDSSHASGGWATRYIYVTFTIGSLLLCTAFYIEGWIAEQPLLPFDMFASKYMKPLCVSLFFSYGVFGIYLFYASFYIKTIIGATPLLTTAWFAPMAIGGLVLATQDISSVHSFSLSCLPAQIFGAWVFPAMVCATIGIVISYSVSNVFITTSLPNHQQGIAGGGGLINCLVFLGISFFLGFADFAV